MVKDRLNNRGQNGAGLVLGRDKDKFLLERSEWDGTDLFRKLAKQGMLNESGLFNCALGHTRYGTSGERRSFQDTQPFIAEMPWGRIAICHNGDSQYAEEDRAKLISNGSVFFTSSDTELFLHYMARSGSDDAIESIKRGLKTYRGTYALLMLAQDKNGVRLIAARDPRGNRPLSLGKLNGGFILASENSTFERIRGAIYERDISPNELLIISRDGMQSELIDVDIKVPSLCQCIYELGYFSRPNSRVFRIPVYRFREELGRRLAKRYGNLVRPGELLSYIPESAKFYAQSFARAIGFDLTELIIRTKVERSFIQENQEVVNDTLRSKFGFMNDRISEILKHEPDIKLHLIDDSQVHGNTTRRITRVFREFGFKSINWYYAEPPLLGPCHKGIDMIGPGRELIAPKYLKIGNKMPDCQALAIAIEADSVNYLPLQDLYETASFLGQENGFSTEDYCFGCFDNRDPIWLAW